MKDIAKLIGYLDVFSSNQKEITFETPIFLKGEKKYWIDFRKSIIKSNNDFHSHFIELNPSIENDIQDNIQLDFSIPFNNGILSKRLYLIKLDDFFACGYSDYISKQIFDKYNSNDIKLYDKSFQLLHFLIYNYDDFHLTKYLNEFNEKEIIQLRSSISNSNQFSIFYKMFFEKNTKEKIKNSSSTIRKPSVDEVINFLRPKAYESII